MTAFWIFLLAVGALLAVAGLYKLDEWDDRR